jgi:hypothetical protein
MPASRSGGRPGGAGAWGRFASGAAPAMVVLRSTVCCEAPHGNGHRDVAVSLDDRAWLERVGHDGPGDGRGCVPVWRSDRDHDDDRVGQVRVDDAGGPAPCRLAGCRRERGRVGTAAAGAPDGDGDGVAAEWFVHIWHGKSGLWTFPAGHPPEARIAAPGIGPPSRREPASVRCSLIHGQAWPCRSACVVRPPTLLAAVLVVDTSWVRPFG